MKKIVLTAFFTLIFCKISFCQEVDIEANIEMDYFGNLYVEAQLNSFDKSNDSFIIDSDILISRNYATLLRGINLEGIFFTEYKPKTNHIFYAIDFPNKKTTTTIKRSNFFFTSLTYLPLNKSTLHKKKKFKINFNFKKNNEVIFPDSSDLERKYLYPPPIIVGEFENFKSLGFEVFYLKSDFKKKEKIDTIINIIDDAYNFYQTNYPIIGKKPKIIFLPLDGALGGKTLDGAIIIDSNILEGDASKETRLLAHETAHLWWGVGGIRLDNSYLLEGIAEYMALKYMDYLGDPEYVKKSINTKCYNVEGILDDNEIMSNRKVSSAEKNVLNYDLTPLLFFVLENNKKDLLFNSLSKFYNQYKNHEGLIPFNELDSFLGERGFNSILKDGPLPDFFFIERDDTLVLKCVNVKNQEIEVELTTNRDTKTIKTFLFSQNKDEYIINKKDLKKIIIDPEFKIFQFSRLNDVWEYNNKSIFSNNRYFPINEIDKEVLSLSTKMIDYLFSNNNISISDLTCEENYWLIKKIDNLKREVNKNDNILITGASTYLRDYDKDYNRIEIKLTYYIPNEKKSDFIYFYLYYDKDLKALQNFILKSELESTE